jgi:antitoxin component of MazEF toxin-antitoxin module
MLTTTLRQWGGSVTLPLPKKMLASLDLEVGQTVALHVENNAIVVRPIPKTSFTLAQLMQEQAALKLPKDSAWLDFEPLASELV